MASHDADDRGDMEAKVKCKGLSEYIEAFEIFHKNAVDKEMGWAIAAEHDTIYMLGEYNEMTGEELKRLDEIGFYFSEAEDVWICFT